MNRVLLLWLLVPAALTGCTPQPTVPPIVGLWSGPVTTGNLNLLSHWQLRSDGTESVSFTMPQGSLITQGTFTLHDGVLVLRTTSRVLSGNGPKKTMPLVNPMEITYQCQLTGDTLTLTPADTHAKITLIREKP